ncbi:site-specific DNA recombinase [Gammaproteobacteria bacterium]
MNGMATIASPQRCAVYTRVSSDENLDQEYNSIDAQRDSGLAYIQSQRHEGWILVPDRYDDPAYSGGNIERPALKRLLADIERKRIDTVVVYKIDRLTRSLSDFSKIVEVFEGNHVSFVSVTQQINSTSSMGRLMLNVLLSFAQFEREVTGERIRDKIAASKKKGIWMGGIPPLGYAVQNRHLVIIEAEAVTVRRIFKDFVATGGSTTQIANALNAEGITTKAWVTQEGVNRLGARMDKKYLHHLLRNRLYRGEISHKGQTYPGTHPAIIDEVLWEQVQGILAGERHTRSSGLNRGKTEALLRGLLFTPDGEKMYPTWSRKNGRQYRYYISRAESRFGAVAKTHVRVAADQVEAATMAQIQTILGSPESITAVFRQLALTPVDEAQIVLSLTRLGAIWGQLFPAEQQRLVQLMIERIVLVPEGLMVTWRELGWKELLREFAPESIGIEMLEGEGG